MFARALIVLLVVLAPPSAAAASVGVNVSPGWGDTVDGRDVPQMERVLTDFRPHTARMPWVDNAGTWEALRFDAATGIDSLVIDHAYDDPEATVAQMVAAEQAGDPIDYVEGLNEPDLNGGVPAPISDAKLAEVRDRQQRLYQAVAGRWPVLCPAAAWRRNDAALNGLPCDVANVHRYAPSDGTPPEPYDAVLPATDKPIWVTETGFSTYRRLTLQWVVTPQQQRDYLVQMDSMLRANGAARVLVYSLQDTGQNPYKSGNNFGLYSWDGVRKPAAAALRGD